MLLGVAIAEPPQQLDNRKTLGNIPLRMDV